MEGVSATPSSGRREGFEREVGEKGEEGPSATARGGEPRKGVLDHPFDKMIQTKTCSCLYLRKPFPCT